MAVVLVFGPCEYKGSARLALADWTTDSPVG
jgi:hypothetical protein